MLQFRTVTFFPIPSRHEEQFIVFIFSATSQLAEDYPERKWTGGMTLLFSSSHWFLFQVSFSCRIMFSWSTTTFLPVLCWVWDLLPFSLAPQSHIWGGSPLTLRLLPRYLLVASQPQLRLPSQLQVTEMCFWWGFLSQVKIHENQRFKLKKKVPALSTLM